MRTPFLLLLWISLLAGFSSRVYAQSEQLLHQFYNKKNGLNGDQVLQLIQDSSGYIWVLSNQGVYRYDGANFEFFGKSKGGPEEAILRGCIDNKQNIWVITQAGEVFFCKHGRFYRPTQVPQKGIKWIAKRTDGTVTLLYYSGEFWTIDAEGGAQKIADTGFMLTTFIWENDSTVLLSYRQTCYRYNFRSKAIVTLYEGSDLSGQYLRFFQLDGHLYFSCDFRIVDISSGKSMVQLNAEIFDVVSVNGKWWIGALGGLRCWDPALPQQIPRSLFPGTNVTGLLADRDNGLWLGTMQGIYQVLQQNWILDIPSNYENNPVLALNPQQEYIVALRNNFDQLKYRKGNGKWESNQFSGAEEKLAPYYSISRLPGGGFLIFRPLFYLLIPDKGAITKTADQFNGYYQRVWKNGVSYHDGGISFLHYMGADFFEEPNKKIPYLRIFNLQTGGNFQDIAIEDPPEIKEQIFLHRENTLFILRQYSWSSYRISAHKAVFLDSGTADMNPSILRPGWLNKDTFVWASHNGALNLGLPGRIVRQYTFPALQPGETIEHYACSRNYFWMASPESIYRISLRGTGSWQTISFRSIAGNISINDLCYWGDSIWAATDEGLIHFAEKDFYIQSYRTRAWADSFYVQQPPGTFFPWQHTDRLLVMKLNRIDFNIPHSDLALVVLGENGNDVFKFQTGWQQFPLSEPGEMPVRVTSELASLAQSPYMKVKVPYFWWEPAWVKLAFYALIFVLMLLVFRIYTRRRVANVELKRVAAQEQLRSLQLQINPHFLYNTLTSIQNYVMTGKREDTLVFIADFSLLMRRITRFSQYSHISLEEEIDFLKLYLSLEQRRLEFRFRIQLSPDYVTSRKELRIPPLLIQPIVENAVKHGMRSRAHGAELLIIFEPEGEALVTRVIDNGTGIKLPPEFTGTGLQNTRARLSNLWGSNLIASKCIVFEHNTDDAVFPGTCITLYIPLA